VCALLLIEQGKTLLDMCVEFWLLEQSSKAFITIMVFSVIIVNTKVVDNFYI